jgi:argininosuccinate lyase
MKSTSRLTKPTDVLVQRLNASLPQDLRLHEEDIEVRKAWAKGLLAIGILTADEHKALIDGLQAVRSEFGTGEFNTLPSDDSVHTAIERRLGEIIGPVADKLQTGYSRSDQIASVFRLWVMRACDRAIEHLRGLQKAMLSSADEGLDTPMPGYTHLQRAQPTTWGHWMLSHFWPLVRDVERFQAVRERAAQLPLGAGAMAGTSYRIDRRGLAADLGFRAVAPNSIDAVGDRDFAAEFVFAAALTGIHLSRLCEQLILFCSSEFGFIEIDDAYITFSSVMPQKRNPEALELTRAKSGRLLGNLAGLLAMLKALPSAYDRDLQEDKQPVFDSLDTLSLVLPVVAGAITTLTLHPDKMAGRLDPELMSADLADYLVAKGLPYKQAFDLVSLAVRLAERRHVTLTQLSKEDLQSISSLFDDDVRDVFDVRRALALRLVEGGTAPDALKFQMDQARAWLAK